MRTLTVSELIGRLRGPARTFLRRLKPALRPNEIYSRAYPSDQAAADLYAGEWTSKLPLPSVVTGATDLFSGDARPKWVDRAAGGVRGKRVLELGPLEGAHSYQLEQLGASVVAIESNQLAFQRCLIAKNALSMKTKFLLGDFIPYLQSTNDRYDHVFAAGVLYHMQDPARVIQDICRIADSVYLWTHHYDETALRASPKVWKSFSTAVERKAKIGDLTVSYHERIYGSKSVTYLMPGFCGGMHNKTYWMSLPDIQATLKACGFEVRALENNLNHVHGPCVSLYASRA